MHIVHPHRLALLIALVTLMLAGACIPKPPNWSAEKEFTYGKVIKLVNKTDQTIVLIAFGNDGQQDTIQMIDGSTNVPINGTMSNSIKSHRGIKAWLTDLDGSGPKGNYILYQYDQDLWSEQ